MTEKANFEEAMGIEREAWKLIKVFDDAAEANGADRRVQYAALIMMMQSFIKTSDAPWQDIMEDFGKRIVWGVAGKQGQKEMPQ